MGQRIAITGGAGFIGSHLARSHMDSGDDVHILVRSGSTPDPARLVAGTTLHDPPLYDAVRLRRCLADIRPDVIYHLATDTGRNERFPMLGDIGELTRDLTNMLTLVAVAADLPVPPRMIVRAGSLAEYGNRVMPAHEEQREMPAAIYTTCAVAGSHYVHLLQSQLPFPVLHARFALAYGPNQSAQFLLPWLVERCLRGEPSEVNCPDDRRDFIHVDDLVTGLRRMANSDVAGGTIINLASGSAPSMRKVADLVLAACGADPSLIAFGNRPPSALRISFLLGATDKAEKLLGWRAQIPLAEGLARLVAWHRRRVYA